MIIHTLKPAELRAVSKPDKSASVSSRVGPDHYVIEERRQKTHTSRMQAIIYTQVSHALDNTHT
jgi:hypothetical protein